METRSDNSYTDSEINTLWRLWNEAPWLRKYNKNLECIYKAHELENERELISFLLRNFKYVDSALAITFPGKIAQKIISNSELTPKNSYLIPRSNERKADGAQKLVYEVVRELKDYSWERSNTSSFRTIIEAPKKNIIVLDDFVGTGNSVVSTIEYFRESMTTEVFSNTDFYLFCIAGMENSVSIAHEHGYKDVEYQIVLRQGISQISSTPADDISLITEMANSKLKAKVNGMKLKDYYLGYGDAEALYFSEEYRVPNNVFPIFWWRKAKDEDIGWTPMFLGR